MSWSYDPELATRTDEVHFLVGDTLKADPLVQDEEIDRMLVVYPPAADKPAHLAAAAICDAIAMKFARQTDKSVGALQVSASQKYEHYKALAATLREAYQTNGVGVPAEGTKKLIAPGIPVLGGGGATMLGF